MMNQLRFSLVLGVLLAASTGRAGDWPQWGGTNSRNMVSDEKHVIDDFDAGRPVSETNEEIDPKTTRNVKWVVKLGSQSYGNPIVAGGRVFVGTNNETPRDPKFKGDRSNLYVFDQATGKFLWELSIPKLGSGKVNDWDFLGLTASSTVEGDRLYVVTNRSEVLCLDVNGMANGNDGPFKDEGKYLAAPGNPPMEVSATDADIIWRFDMREELGVFPHNATSSSIMIVGDRLYLATSNGVDWGHINMPSPNAPAFIALDKKTGQLVGEESVGISKRTWHSNWSSAAFAKFGSVEQVVFGAGDGFVYGFAPTPVEDTEGLSVLKELWRFDADPPEYRFKNGQPVKYPTYDGPSEVIATPVFADGRIYVGIGQDPEHGSGRGNLNCFDPTGKSGDITKSGRLWSFNGIGRSMSTVAVHDGLVFTADFDGNIYCLDAKTGKVQWQHDSRAHIWGSPLVVDGKMYIGNEDGFLMIFEAGRKKKLIRSIDMHAPVYSTPVVSNGTLYVASQTHLYAIGPAEKH